MTEADEKMTKRGGGCKWEELQVDDSSNSSLWLLALDSRMGDAGDTAHVVVNRAMRCDATRCDALPCDAIVFPRRCKGTGLDGER